MSSRPSRASRPRSRSSTPGTRSSWPSASRASPADTLREIADAVATAGTRLSTHTWRSATAGNLGGWQVSRCALPAQRAARRRRDRGRHVPQRLEQVRPPAALHPAASGDVERAHLAGRVPARHERALLPAAALPQGGARLARRLLHARLQPGLDEPRRLLVDRDADRRGADRPARRADADLERDRLPRRLRAAGRARLRAPRSALVRAVRRPVDRLPPARAARGPRTARAAGGGHPGGESGRGLGGERALDRALLADRSRRLARHSALVRVRGAAGREAHRRRVLPLPSSSTPCPGCRSVPRRRV